MFTIISNKLQLRLNYRRARRGRISIYKHKLSNINKVSFYSNQTSTQNIKFYDFIIFFNKFVFIKLNSQSILYTLNIKM